MKADRNLINRILRECEGAMRAPVLLHALANLLTGALSVLTANILGEFADAAFALDLSMGLSKALALALCILAIVGIAPFFTMLGNFSMLKHALSHDNIIFARLFNMKADAVTGIDPGALQYQLEDAPSMLRIHWVVIASTALVMPISWGYLIHSAGNISPLLMTIMIGASLLRLLVPLVLRGRLACYREQEQSYKTSRRAYETEITQKPHVIKLWQLKAPFLNRIDALFGDYFKRTQSQFIFFDVVADQLPALLYGLGSLLLFIAGAVMVARGAIKPGGLASMIAYLTVTQMLLTQLSDTIKNWPQMTLEAKRLIPFYRDEEDQNGGKIARFEQLRAQNLGFAYADKRAFEGLNFTIARGDKVRIAGENGSGKSTLIKLLCRMLSGYEGNIEVNGIALSRIDPVTWRERIAFAPQSPHLFDATVKENILIGNPHADAAYADRLLKGFGIESLVDRSGKSKLSGGERQKISIIRAMLRTADILILDEPTNHLDRQSIEYLKDQLLQSDRTVIVISHDKAMDDVADKRIQMGS